MFFAALPLVASTLLTATDPAGDVRGDGSYVLPSAIVGGLEPSLDLRAFRAENVEGRLRLVVGLGGTDNPWNAPGGFSVPLLDVFVKTKVGGVGALGDTGLNAPPGSGWQRRVQVSGFRVRSWDAAPDGAVTERAVGSPPRLVGGEIVVDTDLPAGAYSYWVTSRIYTPLSPQGFLATRVGGGDAALVASGPGLPSAVDVLYAGDQARVYVDRVLPATGELHDRRPLALLGLGAAGLVVAVLASFRAWRRT